MATKKPKPNHLGPMESPEVVTSLNQEKLPAPKGITILTGPEDEQAVKEHDIDREEAVRAVPFKWRDQVLAPFAIDREADWLATRAALNRPDLGVLFANPISFLADAVAILWFCSVEPEEWIGLSAFQIDNSVRKWAIENVGTGEQEAAITLAITIFNRAHSTQSVTKPGVGKSGK